MQRHGNDHIRRTKGLHLLQLPAQLLTQEDAHLAVPFVFELMQHFLHRPSLGKIQEGRGPFNSYSTPQHLHDFIVFLIMKLCLWQLEIAMGAEDLLLGEEGDGAALAEGGEEEVEKVCE